MNVELVIRQGSLETYVTIEGYWVMVEAMLLAVKEAVRKEDSTAEIK